MTERFGRKQVHDGLGQYIRNRTDIGVGKGLRDAVLEPANPFAPKAARLPRRWFVLFVLLVGTLLGCFVYFNNLI